MSDAFVSSAWETVLRQTELLNLLVARHGVTEPREVELIVSINQALVAMRVNHPSTPVITRAHDAGAFQPQEHTREREQEGCAEVGRNGCACHFCSPRSNQHT